MIAGELAAMGANRTNIEQFQLRLPPGLRDRVKAYAERRGTSINTEIVRVLEREFPIQWPFKDRLRGLADAMSILSAGKDDPRVNELIVAFKETVQGVVSGRVTGVPTETREAIESMWRRYQESEAENEIESWQSEIDEEEARALEIIGRPDKYAIPPERAKELQNLTDEELKIYILGFKAAKADQRRIDNLDDDNPFLENE